jgi:hypothetical protein
MSLIEQIQNENHPFFNYIFKNKENFLKNKNAFRNFQGKDRVYHKANGAICKEEIARELIINTILKNEKHFFNIEESSEEQGGRIDINVKVKGKRTGIYEFKNVENIGNYGLKKTIQDAFIQAVNYIVDDQEIFVSCIITDIEVLFENPEKLTSYFNASVAKRSNPLECLQNYGIYIETRRYNYIKKECDENNAYYNLPTNSIFSLREKYDGIDGNYQIVSTIEDALYLPTKSLNSEGTKNIRDIKDPNISPEKSKLVLDIQDTIIQAYKNKTPYKITQSGKEKDFLYSKSGTIIINNDYDKSVILSTIDGAIIDGQNSIDGFRWIVDYLKKMINDNIPTKTPIGFEKNIERRFKDHNINTPHELKDILKFILNVDIGINTISAQNPEDACNIAISKNNSMQVTKSEMDISASIAPIQEISNFLWENYNINLYYPKKEVFFMSDEILSRTIEVQDLVKYADFTTSSIKENLLKRIQGLSNGVKNDHFSSFIKNYTSLELKDNTDSNKILKEIRDLENTNNSFKGLASITEEIENIILDNDDKIKTLRNQLKNTKDKHYEIKNINTLKDIILVIFNIRKFVNEKFNEQNINDFHIIKEYISNKTKMVHHLFGLFFYKNEINGVTKILSEKIDDVFNTLLENIRIIHDEYKLSITDIRNQTDSDLILKNTKTGEEKKITEIRNDFNNVGL